MSSAPASNPARTIAGRAFDCGRAVAAAAMEVMPPFVSPIRFGCAAPPHDVADSFLAMGSGLRTGNGESLIRLFAGRRVAYSAFHEGRGHLRKSSPKVDQHVAAASSEERRAAGDGGRLL